MEIGVFHGRRPISQKMSRPWNRELSWSLSITVSTETVTCSVELSQPVVKIRMLLWQVLFIGGRVSESDWEVEARRLNRLYWTPRLSDLNYHWYCSWEGLGCCEIFLSRNFRTKVQNMRLKNCILGKFSTKIEIVSARYFLCRIFAVACRNAVEHWQWVSKIETYCHN